MGYAEDSHWTQRELTELRMREAHYREELETRNLLRARLRESLNELNTTLRKCPPTRQDLLRVLGQVALISGRALQVRRASVWLHEPERDRLNCAAMVVDGVELTACDAVLENRQISEYVRALSSQSVLAVENTQEDARTSELRTYLAATGVGALLDIPVLAGGALAGVICHEHVGSMRRWQPEEEDFGAHLGSLVTLALETEKRVHAEYTAQGAEAKYRYLVESLPVVVYSVDPQAQRLEYLSPQLAHWEGVDGEAWLSEGLGGWLERICPEDRAVVIRRVQPGPSCGLPEEITYRVDLPGSRKRRWVRDTCRVLRSERGEPLVIQGVLADITSQTESELTSAEYMRRIHSFLENCSMVAVWLDTEGKITDVNGHFELLTGWKKEEVLGHDWYAWVTPQTDASELRASFEEAMRSGKLEARVEYTFRCKSGQNRTLLWTRTALFDTQGAVSGLATVGMDLTERLRLEEELLLQSKTESLGRLAAGLAHDFNNLLTVMMGQAALLGIHAHSASAEKAKAALDVALKQAAELTQSMLVYARREPDVQERTDLDSVLREVVPLATAIAGEELRFSAAFAGDRAQVMIDPTRLRQVFLNLVGNAADATRGVGKSIRAATYVELVDAERARSQGATDGGTFVVLSISDDGPGMDGPTAARIFEPFFSTKRHQRGTGLGMPICQSIVQRVGGFLEVDTAAGQGATFRVFLPVQARAGRPECAAPLRSGPVLLGPKHPRTVLLVLQQAGLERVAPSLRDAGFRVLVAHGFRSAAHHLGAHNVDFLVVEAGAEESADWVLARSARAVRPRLRAVLVTSQAPGQAAGFDRILLKPLDGPQLLEVLESFEAHGEASA